MRETRAVPTPHKSPVCCPIWLAGFPPNNGTAAFQARAAKVRPGKWVTRSLPGWRPAQPALVASLLLSFSTSCPGALTFVLTLSTLMPFLSPSSFLLLCLTQKSSMGDLPRGPWAPPATRKPTAKGKPTQLPHTPPHASFRVSFQKLLSK